MEFGSGPLPVEDCGVFDRDLAELADSESDLDPEGGGITGADFGRGLVNAAVLALFLTGFLSGFLWDRVEVARLPLPVEAACGMSLGRLLVPWLIEDAGVPRVGVGGVDGISDTNPTK